MKRRRTLESLEPRMMLAADFAPHVDLNLDNDWSQAGFTDRGYASAIQADGKIVTAGVRAKTIQQNSQDMLVARYNEDGSVDTSFNGSGFAVADFGDGYRDIASNISLQSDGKIIVAGHAIDYHTVPQPDYTFVARFNSDGSPDGRFSSVGKSTSGVVALSDGKILLLSNVENPSDQKNDVKLTRLNSDLTLDAGFGSGGSIIHNYQDTANSGWDMAVQSDGKIVIGGGSVGVGYVARFNANGSLDTSYASAGSASIDTSANGDNSFLSLALDDADNAYLTGGSDVSATGDDKEFVAVKLDNTGSLDLDFGSNGVFRYNPSAAKEASNNVAIDRDGKIVLAGNIDDDDEMIVRVNANGTLDTDFGNNGSIVVSAATGHDLLRGMTIDASNRIVAAGETVTTIDGAHGLNTWLLRINPMVEFSDSFEAGSSQWKQDSQNDWFMSTQRATQGSFSAEVDGRATDAQLIVQTPIDMSAYAGADLKFSWYIESSFDSGEYLALDLLDDQGNWNEVLRLRGNVDSENVWHDELVQLEDYSENHFHDSFQFRFRAKVSSSREDANVDNVRLLGTNLSGPPNVIAVDDMYSTNEDTQLVVSAASGVLINDTDLEGDPLEAVLVVGPANGSLTLNANGSFTYGPDINFNGSDSFTYRAGDGTNNSNTATVTITVDPVNDAPVADAQSVSAAENTAGQITLTASDLDGDSLTYSVVSEPTNGTLSGDEPNLTYTPNAGYAGSDSFTFKAHDGTLDSNVATVSISVNAATGTKFYVVDASADDMFEYQADGTLTANYDLGAGNNSPRGAAATETGDTVWVIDNDDHVYVHDDDGTLLRSWKANGLSRPEGIATDGTHVWIVDRGNDRVHYFAGGATRTSDTSATSSFSLAAGNPRGITTDGTNLWVVDTGTDDAYKYTISGTLLGSWALDSRNAAPRGITINPGDVDDIWVIDSSDDDIYEYSGAASRTSGSQAANAVFNLASGNTNPQGIADPPPILSQSEPALALPSSKETGLPCELGPTAFARATAKARLEFSDTVNFGGQTDTVGRHLNDIFRGVGAAHYGSGNQHARAVDMVLSEYDWAPLEHDLDDGGEQDDLLVN